MHKWCLNEVRARQPGRRSSCLLQLSWLYLCISLCQYSLLSLQSCNYSLPTNFLLALTAKTCCQSHNFFIVGWLLKVTWLILTNETTILQQMNVRNDLSSIWHRDSNAQPLWHESPPVTTKLLHIFTSSFYIKNVFHFWFLIPQYRFPISFWFRHYHFCFHFLQFFKTCFSFFVHHGFLFSHPYCIPFLHHIFCLQFTPFMVPH